jgi:hypothetical protein
MKISRKFLLPLAALLFAFALAPQAAMAGAADCPTEPKSNVAIASGDVYAGTNCTLNTTGDVDSFVFSANSGDIYQITAGINTGSVNICLALYDPSFAKIFSGCSNIGYPGEKYSVVADQTLAATGTYTMVVTEASDGALNYGASLERIYPTPPDGQKVALASPITGTVTPVADTPAFTFAGVTTGEFEVTASVPSSAAENLCITVYSPKGTPVTPTTSTPPETNPACTNIGYPGEKYTVTIDFTPTQAGTYLVLLNEAGDAGTVAYNFEVSCLLGGCTPPPPSCTLTNTATYDSTTSTLTMDFTEGNTYAAVWHTWLNYQGTMTELFSVAQPITVPPVAVTKTTTLAKEGVVAVISTLTTATKGITCSSYVKVATGTP